MKESLRYLNNAKEILKSVSIENNIYTDKPVREAFSTAYLAILEAINEYLVTRKGFTKKELSKLVVSKANPSVDAYRDALHKHIAIRNGKLMRDLKISTMPCI